MRLTSTPYLILFVILIGIGVGTATAVGIITLAGNVIVTGDLDVEGDILGKTIDEINQKFDLLDKAPIVDAGLNMGILFGTNASLNGDVTDDGLPNGFLTSEWSKQLGQGIVTFENSSNSDTVASFSETDAYILRLTATDGKQSAFDEVTVSVQAPPIDATVSIPLGSSGRGCEQTNECYIPAEVFITEGSEIRWSNDDSLPHTVTSGTPESGPDFQFDSGLFMAGESFLFKFDEFEPGDYPYFCMVHPWMTGKVTVLLQ